MTKPQYNSNFSSSMEPEDPTKGMEHPKEIITFHATTSMSDFASTSMESQERDENEFIKIDAKTSTASIQPCFYPGVNFYQHLQPLECHDAHHSFNNGTILTDNPRDFRIMVGKFVCAFLNTNGGTLYFGVTKAGKIIGVKLNRKTEDTLRIDIDSQVKEIQPTVPTSEYYVNFATVMNSEGKIMDDLKVLEVNVRQPVREDWFYTYKSVIYIWNCDNVQVHRRASVPGRHSSID